MKEAFYSDLKGEDNISAGRTVHSSSQSWCTPQKYSDLINEFFDYNIELDPCSNEDSIVLATNIYKLPETDGLHQDWNYKNIYVNPPYGKDYERNTTIKHWLKKCCDTYDKYNSEILALIPVATNTSHWKQCIYNKATAICFLYDTRLKFRIDGSETNKGCPMACCFVYWGNDYEKFREVFNEYGYVVKV